MSQSVIIPDELGELRVEVREFYQEKKRDFVKIGRE